MWVFCFGLSSLGSAQDGSANRSGIQPPRRPSISPYLNLGNENSGVLSPYHAFVVPGLLQQQQQIKSFALQARTLGLERNRSTDPELRQTGLGGRFQNYSHFYPEQRSNSKR
jgi:hypothetical protein